VADDLDGKFTSYFRQNKLKAMVVRPDFYVYGGAGDRDDLVQLVDDLAADLGRYGIGARSPAEAHGGADRRVSESRESL
jgi:hypothetical protein